MRELILVIEDEEKILNFLRRGLIYEGYRVETALDGTAGLASARDNPPDLVILDWMLPRLDGLEVLRRLRQAAPTPVLMLTARDEEADRVLGLEVGADDYLTKPFSMRELLARVRAQFRRAELIEQTLHADRSADSGPVRHGPLYLDPEGYLVTLDGHPLDLTRTEFLLLHLLLRNPGRAFSRDYLLDAVWGQGYVEGDRSVDNAVLRLRKKLGALAEAIETVWGIGYRWQSEHQS
jgi:DNA-binding response OmpR family regulator